MECDFSIGNLKVGSEEPSFFIADIAANHDGDLERAKDLIFLAAEAGANAIKFQHFEASSIVSDKGFKDLGGNQSHQSSWGNSVYEVYRKASVNISWTEELKQACDEAGVPFFTTPYSLELLDQLDPYVPAFKLGSGDITWRKMVEAVALKQKPYILATGASTFDEVVRAVDWGTALNNKFCLMQCNTNYTASQENFRFIQLNVLQSYRAMYPNMVLGLSDHTAGHSTVLGAIALGARMIEKHFTDDTSREGPDHKFSMDPVTWKEMILRSRELELALGDGVKKVEENELETVVLQRRAYRATKTLKSGMKINPTDFEPLRPCPRDALVPSEELATLDGLLRRDIEVGDYLKISDLE